MLRAALAAGSIFAKLTGMCGLLIEESPGPSVFPFSNQVLPVFSGRFFFREDSCEASR